MNIKNARKKTSYRTRPEFLVCLFLVLITAAVYCQVRNHEFVDYDDGTYVTKNPHIHSGLNWKGISWAFTSTRAGNWHPLTWLSHMLDVQLYGMNAGGHHLTNVVFHILNTLLLFLLFRRMTGDMWQGAFVAALFALHPLHVESVAWISERKDVLSTFFWIVTLLCYVRYVRRPGINRYLTVIFFYSLGLMSKPMLVTLPFLLLLLDYWPLKRFHFGQSYDTTVTQEDTSLYRLFIEKAPLFAMSAISSVATCIVQQYGGAVGSLGAYSLAVRVANSLISYVAYLWKMIWPFDLAVLYPYPRTFPLWQILGACFVVISISLVVLKNARLRPYLAVGWLWYIGTLVPVIGLVQIGSQAMADRYTYMPLIGIFIIIAWGVPEFMTRWRQGTAGLAIGAAVFLIILTATTWVQTGYWANSITLFRHALDVTEDNYVAHNNLGLTLISKRRLNEGIFHCSESLRINPGLATAHASMGIAMVMKGRIAEAIGYFSEALRINPDFADAHYNLGNTLANQGRIDEAVSHYTEVLRLNPRYVKAHYALGNALAEVGRGSEAIKHYLEALRINPYYSEAHNNLGITLLHKGRIKEAIAHFREALRIRPGYARAQGNLTKALAFKGKTNGPNDKIRKQ